MAQRLHFVDGFAGMARCRASMGNVDVKGEGPQTWPVAATLNDMFAGCSGLTELDFPDRNGLPSSTM